MESAEKVVESLAAHMQRVSNGVSDDLASRAVALAGAGYRNQAARLMLASDYAMSYDMTELSEAAVDVMPDTVPFNPSDIAREVLAACAVDHASADIEYFAAELDERASIGVDEALRGLVDDLQQGVWYKQPNRAPHTFIERIGDDALVRTNTDYVVAHGYDERSGTWSHGTYFGDDLLAAACAAHGRELRDGHEHDGYIRGVDVDLVLSLNPDLTREQARVIAECANDNLSGSTALQDVLDWQVEAEVENFLSDGEVDQVPDDPITAAHEAASISAGEHGDVDARVDIDR